MNTAAFPVALRAFARRRPFQPFLLELVTGERFPIGHPEALTLRGEVVYYIDPQGLTRLFSAASVCQFLEVPAGTAG